MSDNKNQNLETLAKEFAGARDEVKAFGEEIKGRMEKGEKDFTGLKEQADDALIKLNEIMPRLTELEQKAARPGGNETEAKKSLGQMLAESPDLARFKETSVQGAAARIAVKATISSLTTDADGSAGALVTPQRLPGIQGMPQRKLFIRDLLMAGTTGSNAIEYVRETGFNNKAASAAEGAAFAYSDLKFDTVSTGVKAIGHLMKASRYILDDAAMLQSVINQRMVYGVKEVEDRQILNGDGTGNNLKGILPQATAFADPATLAKYSIIDQLRLAMLQAVLAEYPASGHVLNPIDWAKIELEKDGEGRHILGNPRDLATPMLWRLPVVETTGMAAGNFLTGAFNLGAQLFDREDVSVEVATENSDDFEKNLVTIKCYERLALAVYRPEAFIKGSLVAKV